MTTAERSDTPTAPDRAVDERLGLVELDPRVALRPGRADAVSLWVVYLMKKSFYPLLLLSASVLSLTGRDGDSLDGVDTFDELIDAIESPLVILLLAVSIRFAVAVLGFALAYPLSHRADMVVTTHRGRRHAWGRWMDRLHITRAYRSLRWTKAVRNVAADRIGAAADPMRFAERLLTWALPVLLVASLVAHAAAT